VSSNDINSVVALSSLINMHSLDLSDTKVESLNGLEKLNKLHYINLKGLGEMDVDVTSIVDLPDIRYIRFDHPSSKFYKKIKFKSSPYIF